MIRANRLDVYLKWSVWGRADGRTPGAGVEVLLRSGGREIKVFKFVIFLIAINQMIARRLIATKPQGAAHLRNYIYPHVDTGIRIVDDLYLIAPIQTVHIAIRKGQTAENPIISRRLPNGYFTPCGAVTLQ